MCYNLPAQIHTLAPGWKGKAVAEIDEKILALFCSMSQQQKEEIIRLAQIILASGQAEAASDPAS